MADNDIYFDETDKVWRFDGSDDGFPSKAEAVRQFVRFHGREPDNDEAWTGEQVGHGDVNTDNDEALSAQERRGDWPANYVTTTQRAAEGFAEKDPPRETETTDDRLAAGVIGPIDDPVQRTVPGVITQPLDEDEVEQATAAPGEKRSTRRKAK